MIRDRIWDSWQKKLLTLIAMFTVISMIAGAFAWAIEIGHSKIKECAKNEVNQYFSYKSCALEARLISIEAGQTKQSSDITNIRDDLQKNNRLLEKLIISLSTR